MLLKTGVDISRLLPPIRKKLNLIADVVEKYTDEEMVITSTYEGNHSPNSLHYANLAIDIRKPDNSGRCIQEIIASLDRDYDVVTEANHIHIEYDPK
jgi:hypothetical protein